MRAFNAVNPDQDLVQIMLDKIAKEKLTAEWTEKGGKYIPHPATWLNGKRWEDEETEVAKREEEKPWYERNLSHS